MKINKKGFTLVELLVVIAIIGILSTVAVVNLNSARLKARTASVQATLSQLTSAAILCQDEGENLQTTPTVDCNGSTVITAGGLMCPSSSTVWPVVSANSSGFTYNTDCASSHSAGTWTYSASGGGDTITCTNAGCIKS